MYVKFIIFLPVVLLIFSHRFVSSTNSTNDDDLNIINPAVFFPCLKRVCDKEYGCFDPMIIFPRHVINLPPISGCPELHNKHTVRFLVINQDWLFVPGSHVRRGSKVTIFIHGIGADYDNLGDLLIPLASRNQYDYAVAVDWNYLSLPYSIDHVPLPVAWTSLINTLLVGRIVCKFGYWLIRYKQINPNHLEIIGFSAGASTLASVGDYCWQKYGFQFEHFVALDVPGIPFRGSNYPVTNFSHAKVVDVLLSTLSPDLALVEDLFAILTFSVGASEAEGHCVWVINPDKIRIDQPRCDGIRTCSHWFAVLTYASAISGKCIYYFSTCPSELGLTSSHQSGLTRFDCRDHPYLRRTCVNTTDFPITNC